MPASLPLHELFYRADTADTDLSAALYDAGCGHNEAANTSALVRNIADELESFVAKVSIDFRYADPDMGLMLAEVLATGLGLPAHPLPLLRAQMAVKRGREEAASGMRKVA